MVKKNKGLHKGWYKNPNNPHNPNYKAKVHGNKNNKHILKGNGKHR